jgi:hypothetical protein
LFRLACSFEEVRDRIATRGRHVAEFAAEPDPRRIANAFWSAVYGEGGTDDLFFGLSQEAFNNIITKNEIVWAPDGDEAFDDSSYVLQFDQGDHVRLIGFKSADSRKEMDNSTADVVIPSDEFYGILETWANEFESEWVRKFS